MLGIPLAALILVAATFPPQQPSQSMLKIRVQDGTGASIPDATVQIQSEGSEHNIARTDQNGEASVTLDPGRYKLLVQAPGFAMWSTSVDLAPRQTQTITEALKIGPYPGPVLVEFIDISPRPDYAVPDAAISETPLLQLPLPAHKFRLRNHRSHKG